MVRCSPIKRLVGKTRDFLLQILNLVLKFSSSEIDKKTMSYCHPCTFSEMCFSKISVFYFAYYRLDDPYTLSCNHSFCKRPCLLPYHNKITDVHCPFCYVEMPVSDLRPNWDLDAQVRGFHEMCRGGMLHTVKCPVCSTLCLNPAVCSHCNQRICESCILFHCQMVCFYVAILLTVTSGFNKSLQIDKCQTGAHACSADAFFLFLSLRDDLISRMCLNLLPMEKFRKIRGAYIFNSMQLML